MTFSCGDLISIMLDGSAELFQLIYQCVCIRHVRNGSPGQYALDSGLYARVEPISAKNDVMQVWS
jgi:hypothetical protein